MMRSACLALLLCSSCASGTPALRPETGVVLGEASTLATGRGRALERVPPARLAAEVAEPLPVHPTRAARSPRELAVRTAAAEVARDAAMVQVAKSASPVKRTRKGTRIAARARKLVGVSSLRRVSSRYPDDCTGLVRVAAEPEGVVLFDDNARASDNGVTAIWRRARAAGALHKRRPRPGDLVFFRETYDRNRDGRRNDGLTHIAVVESVAPDGTVTFVHRGGKGVSRSRMNLKAPRDKKRNDYLRSADRRTRAYLTGELFAVYASPEKL